MCKGRDRERERSRARMSLMNRDQFNNRGLILETRFVLGMTELAVQYDTALSCTLLAAYSYYIPPMPPHPAFLTINTITNLLVLSHRLRALTLLFGICLVHAKQIIHEQFLYMLMLFVQGLGQIAAVGENAGLKVGQPVVYLSMGAFAEYKVFVC